jgi:hypothetical protein
LPEVRERTLASGAQLGVVERPGAHALTVHVVVRVPSYTTEERRTALWALEGALEGARAGAPRGAQGVSTALRPQVIVSAEAAHLAWTGPAAQKEAALELFSRLLATPTLVGFEAVSWQLERRQQRELGTHPTSLLASLDQAGAGSGGVPTQLECQRWLRRALHPANTRIFLVGPVTARDVAARLEERLKPWQGTAEPRGEPAPPAPASAPRPTSPAVRLGNAEGRTWAHLRMSFDGPARASSSEPPVPPRAGACAADMQRERAWAHLQVGLRALERSGRLEATRRAHRATAFSVSASATPQGWRVHLEASAPADQIVAFARELQGALEQVLREGFPEEELATAFDSVRASLRHATQDPRALARLLAELDADGLARPRLEAALTPACIDRDGVRHAWSPDRAGMPTLTTAVAGDARRLERAFASWREVHVFDPKKQLQLTRRVPHDPSASAELATTAQDEQGPEEHGPEE